MHVLLPGHLLPLIPVAVVLFRQVMMGDGQVSQGDMVVKPNATKVRKLADGRVLAGYAGSTADALTLIERLEGKLEEHEGTARYGRQLSSLLPSFQLCMKFSGCDTPRSENHRHQRAKYIRRELEGKRKVRRSIPCFGITVLLRI